MDSNHNRELGKWGEQVAVDHLEGQGYLVLSRNVHYYGGEIDIVALQVSGTGSHLVFVEVKTRTNEEHGFPEEAFSRAKHRHLLHSIQEYLADHPRLPEDWRIDVIAVLGCPGRSLPQVRHYQGFVMPDERE